MGHEGGEQRAVSLLCDASVHAVLCPHTCFSGVLRCSLDATSVSMRIFLWPLLQSTASMDWEQTIVDTKMLPAMSPACSKAPGNTRNVLRALHCWVA